MFSNKSMSNNCCVVILVRTILIFLLIQNILSKNIVTDISAMIGNMESESVVSEISNIQR